MKITQSDSAGKADPQTCQTSKESKPSNIQVPKHVQLEHAWQVMLLHVWHAVESSMAGIELQCQARCVSTAHPKCSNVSEIWRMDKAATIWCQLM